MNKGDVILCPIFSIANVPKPIVGEGIIHELVTINGQWFLSYRVPEQDLGLSFEKMFLKFRFFCTGLSIATIGHFWVQDVLLNADMEAIWERKKTIQLVVNKEIDRTGPVPLTIQEFVNAQDVTAWIAINYPRVFNYHHIGLFLLRSSLSPEYLYADVLLNFFKIVELVIYKRARKKPQLKVILEENKKLRSKNPSATDIEPSEIREFYNIRNRDAAHDWDKVRGVTRKKAVDCKLWAERLIIADMFDRSKKHSGDTLEVHDSPQGAVVRRKPTGNDASRLES